MLAKSSSSPTVHNASRLAIDHLDLTYLCLCNLNSMAAEFTQEAVENAAEAALAGKAISTPQAFPETVAFLADTRYLLLVVAAEAGRVLLRWQEEKAGSKGRGKF